MQRIQNDSLSEFHNGKYYLKIKDLTDDLYFYKINIKLDFNSKYKFKNFNLYKYTKNSTLFSNAEITKLIL